jgi:hypothetical protein
LSPFHLLACLATFPFRKRQTPEERAGLRPIRIADLVASARDKRWSL